MRRLPGHFGQEPSEPRATLSVVPLTEGLGSGHPVSQYGGSRDRILDQIDGCKSTIDPVEFIGLVEPLVLSTYNVVDRQHEADSRSIQWSCR